MATSDDAHRVEPDAGAHRVEPDAGAHRVDHDAMGPVVVPAEARYGAQTQRAVENFPISGLRIDRRLIRALALVKAEAARVNASLDEVPAVDDEVAEAIAAAAEEVADGRWDDQFPVDVFQTGSGTSSNMNVNEVLSHLATARCGRAVHPNDHVNASQSSNDVFPTAVQLAVAEGVRDDLLPALAHLSATFSERSAAFAGVVKAGRTHLMDATPMTLGQELGGYAAQVAQAAERLEGGLARLGEVPLGGTAVGTGINAPPSFGPLVVSALAERTGLPLSVARDRFAAQGSRDALVDVSGLVRVVAVALVKVANDLRWLSSGPRTGLAEIHLPDLQPGSSIMPGKVNPVIPEAVAQVGAHVIGNDAAVAFAGSQGNLELNVHQPLMAHELLESVRLLANVSRLFADRCVAGITADEARCRAHAEASPQVATALAPHLGYETTAALVARSAAEGTTVRALVVADGLMSEAEVDAALDIEAMTRGGILDRPE